MKNKATKPDNDRRVYKVTLAQTGFFLRMPPTEYDTKGVILCRIADGNVYIHDRNSRSEVEIPLGLLNELGYRKRP